LPRRAARGSNTKKKSRSPHDRDLKFNPHHPEESTPRIAISVHSARVFDRSRSVCLALLHKGHTRLIVSDWRCSSSRFPSASRLVRSLPSQQTWSRSSCNRTGSGYDHASAGHPPRFGRSVGDRKQNVALRGNSGADRARLVEVVSGARVTSGKGCDRKPPWRVGVRFIFCQIRAVDPQLSCPVSPIPASRLLGRPAPLLCQ
jgi:hypothetical protein